MSALAFCFAAKSRLLSDLHRAEFGLHIEQKCAVFAPSWGGLVVISLGGVGVERQVELVAPAEFEAGPA